MEHKLKTKSALLLLLFLAACQPEKQSQLDQEIDELDLQPLPALTQPTNNPGTTEKIQLGKFLFWDPIISGHKDVACATCHHPAFGYSDGLDLPIGVNGSGLGPSRTENTGGLNLSSSIERVPRNSPSVLNTAYNGMTSLGTYDPLFAIMFWDGRMQSLESQCQGPPNSRSEMRGDAYADGITFDSIIPRLKAIPGYVNLFNTIWGGGADAVTREHYAQAIAAFERTISTLNSSYDQYLNGNTGALTDQQKRGLLLFFGKASCNNCHSGPMLSDFNFHALGVPDNTKHPEGTDKGKDNLYKFRTPTLRNVTLTAPYMHSGVFETLEEAVGFLNNGVSLNPNVPAGMVDMHMKPAGLSAQEKQDLIAFLESLTDNEFDKTAPTSVPSGLQVGGNID